MPAMYIREMGIMDRERYIQVAREEALKLVEQRGDVNFIFICGSIGRGDPKEYSDVDLRVVIDTEGDPPRQSFVIERGVPLEWSYRAKRQYEDVTEVLNDPFMPMELLNSVVLYDPDHLVRDLITEIKPVYKQPLYTKARAENLLKLPRKWLPILRESSKSGDERSRHPIYAWDLRCLITLLVQAVLTLANITPGGMKMFVSLRRAAQELQDEELFSLGLNAMGAQDITKEELEGYSADIFKACEYVNSSIDTDKLIFWHLSPDKRQYWRGGIQWLIDNGFCRESVWSLITLAPACLVEMQEAGLESEVSHGCISFLRRLGLAPFGDAEEKLDVLQTWMQRTQRIIDQIA